LRRTKPECHNPPARFPRAENNKWRTHLTSKPLPPRLAPYALQTASPILPLLLIALACPGHAFAQQAPARPEPLNVPAASAAPLSDVPLEAPTPVAPPIELPVPFVLRAFTVAGLKSVPADAVQAVLSPWLGRTASAEELAQAAAAVTRYLREQGLLVAQANVHKASDGVVEISVLEGRIGTVRLNVSEDLRLRRLVAEGFLEALHAGDTLRRDNVEHTLLLLNDLPGIAINAQLAASTPPGTADVLVDARNDGNFATGTLIIDNAGLRSTGEYRVEALLRLRSPLRLGDLLSLRAQTSHTGEQSLASLTYGLPVNTLGTRFGVQASEQRYRLGREFEALDAHGEQRGASVLVGHPVLRRNDHNLIASASYSALRFDERIDAVAFANQTTQRIAALGLTADSRDSWLGGGSTTLHAQHLSGRVEGGLSGSDDFSLTRFAAQRTQTIDARSSLLLALQGQIASKNVEAGSELAVGGPNAVRAYPVGELYADEGYVARVEYRRSVNLIAGAPTMISAFIDDAHVRIERNPTLGSENKRSFRGCGLGLRQQLATDVMLQSSLAWRMTEAATTDADRRPRAWVAVGMRF
jgi:hemolysin activation/secretion protein